MKIALINTFNALPGHVGTVESFHRSVAAAERANKSLQAAVKLHNGSGSYLPTLICEVDPAAKKGILHESMVVR